MFKEVRRNTKKSYKIITSSTNEKTDGETVVPELRVDSRRIPMMRAHTTRGEVNLRTTLPHKGE